MILSLQQHLMALLIIISGASAFGQDIIVSQDGNGDFITVQEAITSVRSYTPIPKIILVKNGIYKEKIIIPANTCNITLVGENKDSTIITYNDHANINKMGTFKTSTVRVDGNNITLKNITIENNAPQLGQAVALHIEGHQVALIDCILLGNQDTVFTGNGFAMQYFKNCYIEGTTDFIFGPARVWFEACTIHCKKNSYITAASTSNDNAYGYVFNHCKITHAPNVTKVYLGRPWRAYASVLFMNCEMDDHIRPEGWHNWKKPEKEKTARYAEYNNLGKGANTEQRVLWSKQLSKKEAKAYQLSTFFEDWDVSEL